MHFDRLRRCHTEEDIPPAEPEVSSDSESDSMSSQFGYAALQPDTQGDATNAAEHHEFAQPTADTLDSSVPNSSHATPQSQHTQRTPQFDTTLRSDSPISQLEDIPEAFETPQTSVRADPVHRGSKRHNTHSYRNIAAASCA